MDGRESLQAWASKTQTILDNKTMITKLREYNENLNDTINELSDVLGNLTLDNGHDGILYRLKDYVQADTDLGNLINQVGGKVSNARERVIEVLKQLQNIIDNKILDTIQLTDTTGQEYQQYSSEIENIHFKSMQG